jgi:hypothetical protein
MRVIGRSMFNGRFVWGREPKMTNNYIIIVGWANGSVIVHTQNNRFKYYLSCFLFRLKIISTKRNTTFNSIINISATHASKAKANLDATNIDLVIANRISYEHEVEMVVIFYVFKSSFFYYMGFYYFIIYLMCLCGFIKKNINIPMCWKFVNIDIACYKMSF